MKKILMLVTTLLVVFSLSACGGNREKLFVLNWGDYMDSALVEQFEDEFNVDVVYDVVSSNEEMEVKIKAGTTKYDIVIPSDYMIDKLSDQNLLNPINFDLLTGLDEVSIKSEVASLTADKDYNDYFVPYFWGTLGIMYNTTKVNEEDLTGWGVLFDPETNYSIGMYDSARDVSAAALLNLGYNVNSNDPSELSAAEAVLAAGKFSMFGEDNLRGLVKSGNIDMALVYSGDYFDILYATEEDEEDVEFGYFVPETTNIWVDGFVIPTISENVSLAHDFINFFMNTEVAVQNADWVGYASVLTEAYDILVSDEYGYDYLNYNPAPAGSSRQVFEFISDDRFRRLNELLDTAKNDD